MHLTQEEARRFLAAYHFAPSDLPGVFARLGTVQYDPLNPVGRNPDLVLQARVPGYQVDDWQTAAYTDRLVYDAWDKQACLVPMSDWPMRALIREKYQPYHDREILLAQPDAVRAVLDALNRRGPMSALEFEDRTAHPNGQGSWYGTTTTKRILRALWAEGTLVTHHRGAGRHYFERAERVIPPAYYDAPPLLDEAAYYRWIVARRHQAAGLLPIAADTSIWSACHDKLRRTQALAELVADGTLTPVQVGEHRTLYHSLTAALASLDAPPQPPRVIFVGPLDSILWDRKTVRAVFGFDYTWEVYKPLAQRRWGYYVLPVFYGDRFIARIDSRLEAGNWAVARWWWEPEVRPDAELLAALRAAASAFVRYLGAVGISVAEDVDPVVRAALAG
ncbi:MAG: DNA glycosylase AlkZ-like family protein [Chloroflexia bacterium]